MLWWMAGSQGSLPYEDAVRSHFDIVEPRPDRTGMVFSFLPLTRGIEGVVMLWVQMAGSGTDPPYEDAVRSHFDAVEPRPDRTDMSKPQGISTYGKTE